MSEGLCYDLINMIFLEVGIRKQRIKVIQELDKIIESADDYCINNEEEDWVDWRDLKMCNGEWEYAFWENLLD